MEKIIKSDIVIAVIFIGAWIFYLTFDGSTRFDVSETITLPLLAAADFTALAILYAAGRYYTAKKGNINKTLANMANDRQTEETRDKTGAENKNA
ncbi:MAG TPA: hypothetical protein ENI80_03740 [Acidiferrobacteraceae bacterium]|nr:hypothetical protein [Acidiferrobacteraceae bacterium]